MYIHQIWIGPMDPPTFWMNSVKTFASTYGYEYKLWDNKSVYQFKARNQTLLNELLEAKRWPGASDVLRYEISAAYGGVYIDADTVVMKPLEFHTFLQSHKDIVFFGCEYDDCHLIANGIIGSPSNSVFMQDLLESLHVYAIQKDREPDYKRVGPYFLTDFVRRRKQHDYEKISRTVFYPQSWHGIVDPWLHTKVSIPSESLLWQYGYSTNGFGTIFKIRNTIALFLFVLICIGIWLLHPKKHVSLYLAGVLILGLFIKTKYIH